MKIIRILFLGLLAASSCSVATRHYGNYYNNRYYWGEMFVLKPDSTFDYTFRNITGEATTYQDSAMKTIRVRSLNHVYSDSSYGRFIFHGDTIFLNYATPMVPKMFDDEYERADKLVWQGRKLFFIDSESGEVIKEKEVNMKWHKGKVANFYPIQKY